VGEYVIPELLGGPRTVMIGRVLWDEMFSNLDWPMSATVAVVLILVVLLPFVWLTREENKSSGGVLA
jgi:putrescine transport system permease protein